MSTIQTVFGSKSFLVKLLDERHDPQLKLLKPAEELSLIHILIDRQVLVQVP